MGWFSKDKKPQEGEIRHTDLEEDGNKLRGEHPVVVIRNNHDDTSAVVGCTTKKNEWKGDVEIETTPEKMDKRTYARVYDGERDVHNKDLNSDPNNRRVTSKSWKDINEKL